MIVALLLAWGSVQEIDGEDPRASFDAVARLVELPGGGARAAAAGIRDPFYREALLSELEAKENLGARFGRVTRMSVKGGRPAAAYLEDLKAAGIHVRRRHLDAFEKDDAVDLALEDVPPLEVLRGLCRKVGAQPYGAGPASVSLSSGRAADYPALAYRNFLVVAGWARRVEVVDFAGPPRSGVVVDFSLMWDAGVEVAALPGPPVILEAIDENGKALAPAAAGLLPALDRQYRLGHDLELGEPQMPALALAPTASKTIRRLRGYVSVGIPVKTSEFRFDPPKAGVASVFEDDHFEVDLKAVGPYETDVGGAADTQASFRVRPKGGKLEDLRRLSVGVFSAGAERDPSHPFWGTGRFEKGEAAYQGLAVTDRQAVSGLVIKIHRVVVPRRVYFELRNIPLGN